MKVKTLALCAALLSLHTVAFAQTDCDIQKAARHSAVKSTLGVSGNCDAKSAVKEQTSKKLDKSSRHAEREDKKSQIINEKKRTESADHSSHDALKD